MKNCPYKDHRWESCCSGYQLSGLCPGAPHDRRYTADSIYAYLQNQLKLDIAYTQKEITAEPTSHEERQLMKSQDVYMALIRSRVYLSSTQQFQYTESKHKIDKFKFVNFARRKHSF
ncbi:UTRA domain-containing protein [Streptococcus mutans]|nr:UTRA domain-containing protein [Streptococcus mutans]MCB4979658.1 UTRA domain-containing protein [Streptococcus mutans]MCB4999120.1 UTRA domain-containing protein [Streptococcus mutans]MCB5017143.1 UTRA domain-containing protein [Streptococcus mutans]MCB5021621.1 UTRA domain-containing protein [Streptococcus mutans]